jgi:hypothetical protein
MNSGTSPQPLAALEAGRRVRPCLIAAREAFQRGLGEAATCTAAVLAFDDGHDLPALNFLFVTADGVSAWAGERATSADYKLPSAIQERGASAATSIRAGLIGRSSAKGNNNG